MLASYGNRCRLASLDSGVNRLLTATGRLEGIGFDDRRSRAPIKHATEKGGGDGLGAHRAVAAGESN